MPVPSTSDAPFWAKDNRIPCCVPWFDSGDFFKIGGLFSEPYGYHITKNQFIDDFDAWLPKKWQQRGSPARPVLLPDMLPSNTWEHNLRSQLKPEEWDRLRKFCYSAAGNTCVACGSRGEPHVEAHEAWHFDEEKGIQKLKDLLCLCPICHKAKHWGYSSRLGIQEQVAARVRWLNNWTNKELEAALLVAKERQARYSLKQWTLDTSFLLRYGVR